MATRKAKTAAGGAPWPADAVKRMPVKKLAPYAKNARTHSEAQVALIARSIKEFGFTVPVLVDPKGGIIAGHGRVLAAKSLGLAEVPVMVASGWTAAQKRAYVLADNKIAADAGWDNTLLRGELEALRAADFDLGLTGFSADDVSALFDLSEPAPSSAGSLSEKFGISPFSVLNAREGWWQDRKRAWLSLGIESERGRGENLLKMSDTMLEPDPAKRSKRANAQPSGGGGGAWKKHNEKMAASKARRAAANG
jgi:hypothetical protein